MTRPCLLPNLFSKMQSLLHAYAFDDVMKFKILKFEYLKNNKSFQCEKTPFSLVLKVISFSFWDQFMSFS